MRTDQLLYLVKRMCAKAMICGRPHRVKPELCFVLTGLDVNMSRFFVFVAEEKEPISPNLHDGRHVELNPSRCANNYGGKQGISESIGHLPFARGTQAQAYFRFRCESNSHNYSSCSIIVPPSASEAESAFVSGPTVIKRSRL